MINTLISCDDQDFTLGDYFKKSYLEFTNRIQNQNVTSRHLDGSKCTLKDVNENIDFYNSDHFIFIAFSHGDYDCLHTSSDKYVNFENCTSFSNSLFYTTACSSSNQLGPELINNGCHSFIGYDDEVFIHPNYHNDFINCELHAILEFLNSDITIGEAYESMNAKYDETVLRLLGGNIADAVVASTFVDNQRQLRMLGNKELKRTDLES